MEHKKRLKKIGFVFGLKKELKLVLDKNKKKFCVYGYGESSKDATKALLKLGVDIVINLGFAGAISKNLKNGDVVFIDKIFNEDGGELPTSKFDEKLLPSLKNNYKFVKGNLLTVQKISTNKREKFNLVKKFKSVSVIDMEAYHIKEELIKSNIPMISLKVIFDDLSFDIPSYIEDCINDKGDLIIKSFLVKLILNPIRIFGLLKLNAKFSKSKKTLEGLVNSL